MEICIMCKSPTHGRDPLIGDVRELCVTWQPEEKRVAEVGGERYISLCEKLTAVVGGLAAGRMTFQWFLVLSCNNGGLFLNPCDWALLSIINHLCLRHGVRM